MFNNLKKPLTLAGVSAGLMYLFDPDLGNRRRALVRDQIVHGTNKLRRAADVTLRDMKNRQYGAYCAWRSLFVDRDASDEVLADRVRSKMGRYVSHPAAIEVHICDGCVTLGGPILAAEVQGLLNAVELVDGVEEVENCLEVHDTSENIAALQGGSRPADEPAEWIEANWSPTARLIAGTAGGILILNCVAKRTLPAMVCGTAGLVLLRAALRNPQSAQPTETYSRGARDDRSRESRPEESRPVPAGPNTPRDEFECTVNPPSTAQSYPMATDDLIDEALMESFPASDAPSFTRR
jgi:hypothetical protein